MSVALDGSASGRTSTSTSSSLIATPTDSARPSFTSRHSYSQTHRIPTSLHRDYSNDPLLDSSRAGFYNDPSFYNNIFYNNNNNKQQPANHKATTSFSHVSFSGTMSPRRQSRLSRPASTLNNHLIGRGYKSTPNIAGLQQHNQQRHRNYHHHRAPTSSSSIVSDDNDDIFLRTGVRMAQECDEYRGQSWLASRDSSLENLVEIQEFINPQEPDGDMFKRRGSRSYPLLGAIIDEQPFFKEDQKNVILNEVQVSSSPRKGLPPMSLNVALESASSNLNSAAVSQEDDLAEIGSGFGKWLDWITDLGKSPAEAEGVNGDDSASEEEDVKSANILNGQFARCRVSSGLLSRRGVVKPGSSGSFGGDLDNILTLQRSNSSTVTAAASSSNTTDLSQNEPDTPAWARRDAEQEWQLDGVAMFCYWARFAGRFLGA